MTKKRELLYQSTIASLVGTLEDIEDIIAAYQTGQLDEAFTANRILGVINLVIDVELGEEKC